MKEGREKEESERGWICTWGLRELKSPHQGNQLGQRGSTWSCQRVKQLICDTLNGVRTTQTIHVVALRTLDSDTSHCWQQECREWRAIPGRGLLLTMGWWPEGMGERKLWRGMPLEGSLALYRQGVTAESRAGDITISAGFLFPLVGANSWPTEKDQQRGWPFECLLHQATEKDQPGRPFECRLPETSFLKAPYLLHLWLLASWCTWCLWGLWSK